MYFIISPPIDEPLERVVLGDYIGRCYCVGSFRKRHQMTRQLSWITFAWDLRADISILVIMTDPSETVQMRDRHVVLEGRYQLFIHIALNSFSGRLKKERPFLSLTAWFYWRIWTAIWLKGNSSESLPTRLGWTLALSRLWSLLGE